MSIFRAKLQYQKTYTTLKLFPVNDNSPIDSIIIITADWIVGKTKRLIWTIQYYPSFSVILVIYFTRFSNVNIIVFNLILEKDSWNSLITKINEEKCEINRGQREKLLFDNCLLTVVSKRLSKEEENKITMRLQSTFPFSFSGRRPFSLHFTKSLTQRNEIKIKISKYCRKALSMGIERASQFPAGVRRADGDLENP